MSRRLSLKTRILVVLVASILTSGCGSSSTDNQLAASGPALRAPSRPTLDVGPVAKAIVEGVGTVQQTNSIGDKGPVFVFEEYHTSRIGQLQIAAMLVRLHDKYGMRKIGLEGKAQASGVMNANWYRGAGGDSAKDEREDLAVRMVAEGEISSAELMAMQYSDVDVYGTDDAALYAQTLDVKGNPEVDCLLAVAEKSLTQDSIKKINDLIALKKQDEAFETMMNADAWVKAHYEAMKSKTVSAEQRIVNIKELQSKAASIGADVSHEAKQDIEKVLAFYEAASKRSDAMVAEVLDIMASSNGSPVAMIIGAAHSDKVIGILAQKNVHFALIRPADLNPASGSLSVDQYERKVSGQWARDSKGTLGRVLNLHKKPPPVLERISGQGYASMNLAGMLVAKAARSHKRIPDDLLPQLASLPGIRVDHASFGLDGYDVIFRAWLKLDDGREREVWTRVGTIEPAAGAATGTLESKLVKAASDLKADSSGGGGNKGGDGGKKGTDVTGDDGSGERPKGSQRAENEGPGDAKKGDLVISRTGRDTLAVFGSTKEEVRAVGRISI